MRSSYSTHALTHHLPCYAFIGNQDSPVHLKIAELVANAVESKVYYLNDFFFYTSTSFSTPWHVDTELYLFQSAVNAWILLEPDEIDNPLGFIDHINSPADDVFYHSVQQEEDSYIFVDYSNSQIAEHDLHIIEQSHVKTPHINVGDILLLDPARFHRTNTTEPKGACIFKYLTTTDSTLVRANHIPEIMWPELSLYKRIYNPRITWPQFLSSIKDEVLTKSHDSPLISGFYPENFPYLIDRAISLSN